MIRIFITGLLFIAFVGFVRAQQEQGLIQGQMTDKKSGDPLPFSTVAVLSPEDSSTVTGESTGEQGKFALKVSPGNYIFKFQYSFYVTRYKDVTVGEGETVKLGAVPMAEDAEMLEEVTIEGEKSQMVMEQDKRVFNVGADLSSEGASAAEVLDNMPAVNVDSEGNVSLRGSNNVKVLVNGRPSGLVGVSGTEALRNFPANQIERVEVVTNPPARYQAEGLGGIINIILKKDRKEGLNTTVSTRTGIPNNHGVSINSNYKKDWLNLHLIYSSNYRRMPGGGYSNRQFNYPDTSYSLESTTEHIRGGWSHQGRLGADFTLSPDEVLGVSGIVGIGNEKNNTEINYKDFNENGTYTTKSVRDEVELEDERNYEVTLDYRNRYDTLGQKLTAMLQYRRNLETEDSRLVDRQGTPGGEMRTNYNQQSLIDMAVDGYLGQADYVYPIDTVTNLNTGVRAEIRNINNDYNVERKEPGGRYENLPRFSNHFIYQEQVYAAYASYSSEAGSWKYKIGLRAEGTRVNTLLKDTDSTNRQRYFNLFPSAFLNYRISKEKDIQLNYSRRINRPHFYALNPFNSFQDDRSYRTGNPNLKPEFTDSYEIGYMNNTNGSLYLGVYYRHTSGEFESISRSEGGITYSRPENLASQDAYGLEANYSREINSWWSLTANTNLYRQVITGSVRGESLYSDTYTMSARLSNRFDLFDWCDVQLSGEYDAPEEEPQEKEQAEYMINFGASKSVFDDRGNVSLSVRDIFNTNIDRETRIGQHFREESAYQWRQSRQLTLSFSYTLQKMKKVDKSIKD